MAQVAAKTLAATTGVGTATVSYTHLDVYKRQALGLVGAWMGMVCGNLFGDRFTYYPVIAYFWTYVALVVKARHLPPEIPAPRPRR